jgi:tRNA A-37 threonylcarbamoyl transferase component Bud32
MKTCVINTPYKGYAQLVQIIDELPEIFETGGDVLWEKRNTIKAFSYDDDKNQQRKTVIKRFKRPNFIQKLIYTVCKHKARKAYCNGQKLRSLGIATPEPIAFVELRRGVWLTDAYYMSEPTSLASINTEINKDGWNRKLAWAFGSFLATLHDKGIMHHDLNGTNVLFGVNDANDYYFELLDINRMKFYRCGDDIPETQAIENLTRFTDRLDLFEHVVRAYAEARHIEDKEGFVARAIVQKGRHHLRWRRRKAFCRLFKRKKK